MKKEKLKEIQKWNDEKVMMYSNFKINDTEEAGYKPSNKGYQYAVKHFLKWYEKLQEDFDDEYIIKYCNSQITKIDKLRYYTKINKQKQRTYLVYKIEFYYNVITLLEK